MAEDLEYPYEFDSKKRKKAKVYSKQKLFTGLFQGMIIPLIVLLFIYLSSFSRSLEDNVFGVISNTFIDYYWIGVALFVLVFVIIIYLVGLPISYYSGYILEHRYDLSNQTIGQWFKDQLKSFTVMLIFTVPIILGIFYLGSHYPERWWIYAGIISFVIMGVLSNISHLLLLPLFFELEELKDEELSDSLIEMAEENGVTEVEKVMKVKASEKTEKANAAFAGMGRTKRIYLFDTLLDKFHKKEIEGVVAHEMGHYVNRDIIRYVLLEVLIIFPIFYLTDHLFKIWGSFDHIYHLPLFLLILYGLYSMIDPFTLAYSRYREKKADSFALNTVKDPRAMISAFKRLSDIDLAEVDPKRVIEIFFYSHPPPIKRIEMASEFDD